MARGNSGRIPGVHTGEATLVVLYQAVHHPIQVDDCRESVSIGWRR